jgi:hypothetical protein
LDRLDRWESGFVWVFAKCLGDDRVLWLYSKLFIKVKSHLSVLSNLSRPNLSVYDGHKDWQANSDLCFLDRSIITCQVRTVSVRDGERDRQNKTVNSHLFEESLAWPAHDCLYLGFSTTVFVCCSKIRRHSFSGGSDTHDSFPEACH